jgi:sulfotransferase family protein
LNQLEEISAPHPPHILERFIPLLPAYGDLSDTKNFSTLVHDVCSLVAYNPVQWKHISLREDEVIKRCSTHSLAGIVKVIYEMNAENEGAYIWMCKSLANIHFTDLLEEEIKPYYIFLYRDGRDVASSFKHAVVGEKHVYHIAKQWQHEQDLCLKLYEQLGDKRLIKICYEDLISQPEKELMRICAFINAKYNNVCLEYYNSQEAKNTASSGKMWQNVERKIITGNFNNYKKDLSADEIMLFEKIAGTTLQALNYTLDFSQHYKQISTADLKIYDELNTFLKQKSKQQQKSGDAEKRLMQEALINNIRKKLNHTSYNEVEKIAV